jgi:hypothetical protein
MTKKELRQIEFAIWKQVDYYKAQRSEHPEHEAWYSGASKGARDILDIIQNGYYKSIKEEDIHYECMKPIGGKK